MDQKDVELSELEGKKILFVGGSSTTFSVDPLIIGEEVGLVSYNYGGSAQMGPDYVFERAKKHLKSGDVLVIGIEPESLNGLDSKAGYALGKRLAVRNRDLALAKTITGESPVQEWMAALRPGMRDVIVSTARRIKGGRPYAYTMDDSKPKGRLELAEIEFRLPPVKFSGTEFIDDSGLRLLEDIANYAYTNGLQVVYAIPWKGVESDMKAAEAVLRKQFLARVETVLPVLKDESLGLVDGLNGFSDTHYHMEAELSAKRSHFLADALRRFLDLQ